MLDLEMEQFRAMEQLRAQGGYEHRPSLLRTNNIVLALNDEKAYGYLTSPWRARPVNAAMAFNPAEVGKEDDSDES